MGQPYSLSCTQIALDQLLQHFRYACMSIAHGVDSICICVYDKSKEADDGKYSASSDSTNLPGLPDVQLFPELCLTSSCLDGISITWSKPNATQLVHRCQLSLLMPYGAAAAAADLLLAKYI